MTNHMLGEIWRELQISQFSRDNNYTKYTPSGILGCGLLDCHHVFAVALPEGESTEFIRPKPLRRRAFGRARSNDNKVRTFEITLSKPRYLVEIDPVYLVNKVRPLTPYRTPRGSEQEGPHEQDRRIGPSGYRTFSSYRRCYKT